jgi:hypothetical protein
MGMLFALPALVGIVMLLMARRLGELSLKSGLILGTWYVVGFYLQYFGRGVTRSTIGLVLLVVLAVCLCIKLGIGTRSASRWR